MKQERISIFRNLLLASLFTATLILSAGAAHAALSITYTVGNSGAISYDGTPTGDLIGNNLNVTALTGNETLNNAGTALPVTGGLLNFATGALTSHTGNVWNFGSGGTITMLGEISAISGVPASSTLLSGNFLSASVTQLSLGTYQFNIVGATFGDTDNPNIYAFYGVPAGSSCTNALALSFEGTSYGANGFTSTNSFGGTLIDSPVVTPIPAAAWLFGSGLMGLVGIRKRIQI
jgi:hypothetical protein